MAQVIKEVTKELEAENDKKMGRVRSIPKPSGVCKHDRRHNLWKNACRDCRKEEEKRHVVEKDSDDEDRATSKEQSKNIYEATKKIKSLNHVNHLLGKK
jgi:hypothetical protein